MADGHLNRRGFLRSSTTAVAVGAAGLSGCSRSEGTAAAPGATTTAPSTSTPPVDSGLPARTQYFFPPAAEPFAKDLEAAGIPIAYGPNPVPAPAAISGPAREAWPNNSQMPLPPDDPAKLAAVRRFAARTEDVEFDRLAGTYTIDDRTVNGIATLRITPRQVRHPDKAVMFIHGGAWIINSRKTQLALQCALADALGAQVISVDYRLAPEHPYPAALDDVVAAYTATTTEFRAENLGVFGTSAGGGLTLAMLLRLKAEGLPLPAAAAALCPGADMTHSGYLFGAVGLNDPILSPRDIADCMRAYVGTANPTDPLVSPVFGDYSGLPPLFLLATTAEIIGSDAMRIAATARDQNVDVTLLVSDGMWHVPIGDNTGIPELQHAYDQMVGFFRRHLTIAPAAASTP